MKLTDKAVALDELIGYMSEQPTGALFPLQVVSKAIGVSLSTLRELVSGHKADLEKYGIKVRLNPATGMGNPLLVNMNG